MASCSTRSSTEHAIFGQPATLPSNQLPTCEDVIKLYWFYQKQQNEMTTIHDYATRIAIDVKDLYHKAGIPTIKLPNIVQKVKRLIEKMQKLLKHPEKKRSMESFKAKVETFGQLFDVCSCRCFDAGIRDRSSCRCSLPLKIPSIEWEFWVDQKSGRKMVMGRVDKAETLKLQRREERVRSHPALQQDSCVVNEHKRDRTAISDDSDNAVDNTDDGDGDKDNSEDSDKSETESSEDEAESRQNRTKYPELCKAIERCKVSNRQACIIANAVLKDLNLLTSQITIDPAKIQRQRKYWRKREIGAHTEANKNLKCIGFDGKQDETLIKDKKKLKHVKQEHYVVLSYPGNIYIDHVVPQTSKAADVARERLLLLLMKLILTNPFRLFYVMEPM